MPAKRLDPLPLCEQCGKERSRKSAAFCGRTCRSDSKKNGSKYACSKCRVFKEPFNFQIKKNGRPQSHCKECQKLSGRLLYRKRKNLERGLSEDAEFVSSRSIAHRGPVERALKILLTRSKSSMRSRTRVRDFDLSLEWATFQYAVQDGRCFYSGEVLLSDKNDASRPFGKMSIDRLDSSKGYTTDNCVLCLSDVNYCKQQYDVGKFLSICRLIAETWPTGTGMFRGKISDFLLNAQRARETSDATIDAT